MGASGRRPGVTDEMAASGCQEQAERALALVERVNLAVNEQVRPLIDLVERQQAQLLEQAEELGRLRSENAALQARQTMADEMAARLQAQAPKAEPTASADPIATTPVFEDYQSQDPVVRPWWRRWFW